MNIIVAKQDLEAALTVVSHCLSSGGSGLDGHFVFRVREGAGGVPGLEVMTASNRRFSGCPVKAAQVENYVEPKMFTIEGSRLTGLLPYVTDPSVLNLTFEENTKIVVVKTRSASPEFQSLNAETFNLWDQSLQDAKPIFRMSASRLSAALQYSADFVSKEEGKDPNLCVLEARDGVFYSTDRQAATLVRVNGLGDSKLRIHFKDAKATTGFLSLFGEGEVEVKEGDKTQFFIRPEDGAMFGTVRFLAKFPNLGIDMNAEDHHRWLLPRLEILRGIGLLSTTIQKDDTRIRFCKKDGMVVMTVKAATGRVVDFPVECLEENIAAGAPALPPDGFTVDPGCLSKVLKAWDTDTIRFGSNTKGTLGFCRFLIEQDGDKFLSVVSWKGK